MNGEIRAFYKKTGRCRTSAPDAFLQFDPGGGLIYANLLGRRLLSQFIEMDRNTNLHEFLRRLGGDLNVLSQMLAPHEAILFQRDFVTIRKYPPIECRVERDGRLWFSLTARLNEMTREARPDAHFCRSCHSRLAARESARRK